ncbi:MAG TPA: MBL fold metallo-hydrolase [Kofleriaceae bacterium]|nr:MBL fold metallo-hydrolase [Kofleriaceae bacterium]
MGTFDERASKPSRGPMDILKWKLSRRPERRAADFAALDAVRPGIHDGGAAALASGEPMAVWIGHATWALRMGGKLLVTDPVWSRALSGVVRRLVAPGVALAAMPAIDVVLVTHDHRDHMDLPTLRQLGAGPLYIVPLGNGPRIAHPRVVELDWWQSHVVGDLEITLVPARHWSMREPWNRNDSLWGGYVVRGPEGVAYHSGDTGFGDHFAEIGQRIGRIDWAMLPIGAYSPRWFMEPQHMDPIEAAQGFEALGARHLLAMHWGTFRLTDEAIGEPPARLRAHWTERGLPDDRLWLLDVGEPRPLRAI